MKGKLLLVLLLSQSQMSLEMPVKVRCPLYLMYKMCMTCHAKLDRISATCEGTNEFRIRCELLESKFEVDQLDFEIVRKLGPCL